MNKNELMKQLEKEAKHDIENPNHAKMCYFNGPSADTAPDRLDSDTPESYLRKLKQWAKSFKNEFEKADKENKLVYDLIQSHSMTEQEKDDFFEDLHNKGYTPMDLPNETDVIFFTKLKLKNEMLESMLNYRKNTGGLVNENWGRVLEENYWKEKIGAGIQNDIWKEVWCDVEKTRDEIEGGIQKRKIGGGIQKKKKK